MEPLNNVDVVILIGFAVSMFVAFIRGFVRETLSILGMALFVILVVYFSPVFLPFVSKYVANKILAQIVIFLIIMAIFYAVWIIGTDVLISKIRTSTLSFMDRLFGLIFGLLRALIILGFVFLIIKIVLPEELESDTLKKSKFFTVAQATSDIIEKALPDKFIEDTMKSVQELNKVEKKKEKPDKEKADEETKGLPSKVDQDQMNKMFEQLVKPEIKSDTKDSDKKSESKGYDNKETKNLDRLVDITSN